MPEYKLILNADGASLFDADGKPVSREMALALMDKLGEHYKRPACDPPSLLRGGFFYGASKIDLKRRISWCSHGGRSMLRPALRFKPIFHQAIKTYP